MDALVDGRLMEALYEDALHAGDWGPALQRSSELLECSEASLAAMDSGMVTTFETTGRLLSGEARERYQQHYHALDPKIAVIARGGTLRRHWRAAGMRSSRRLILPIRRQWTMRHWHSSFSPCIARSAIFGSNS